MIVLVTYSDANMTTSADLCVSSALKHGVDVAWKQSPNTVDSGFKEFNKDIFVDGARGAGCYWLFKPYHIYKAMLQMQEGDILVYSDAGQEFVGSVKPVIEAMQGDIMLFSNGWPHVEWCKMSIMRTINEFHAYNDTFNNFYATHKQAQASLQIYRVSQQSKDFVKQWLLYCQMPGFIDDSLGMFGNYKQPKILPNYPTFAEHRHDQAILTCCAIKHGIPLHWFPTLTNMHQQQQGDNYPAIINHHRKRNHEW